MLLGIKYFWYIFVCINYVNWIILFFVLKKNFKSKKIKIKIIGF